MLQPTHASGREAGVYLSRVLINLCGWVHLYSSWESRGLDLEAKPSFFNESFQAPTPGCAVTCLAYALSNCIQDEHSPYQTLALFLTLHNAAYLFGLMDVTEVECRIDQLIQGESSFARIVLFAIHNLKSKTGQGGCILKYLECDSSKSSMLTSCHSLSAKKQRVDIGWTSY